MRDTHTHIPLEGGGGGIGRTPSASDPSLMHHGGIADRRRYHHDECSKNCMHLGRAKSLLTSRWAWSAYL